MSKQIKFPKDFVKRDHPMSHLRTGAFQYAYPSFDKMEISIVGGNNCFYCDGSDDSFEMYDFREDEPQGWLNKGQINEHLKNNPF